MEGVQMNRELIEPMRGTPPPKSSDEVWKEHYKLQEEYIEDLEREIDRLKMRILSLEVAGQNVVYQATEMWKHGAIREWLDLTKEANP
jgi:hypothetical protein